MKHASPASLDRLDGLLRQIRAMPPLREKQRGIFYLKAKAFLHFHEDPTGLFADLRLSDWQRFPVITRVERETLLNSIRRALP
jgi:hypothetical protein